MSNRRDIQFTFNPHNKLTLLDCSFVVDHANGNGFGVRSLKQSGRVATVFMNTSAAPGTAPNGQVNPNPIAGIIQVTLQDNYNTYLGGTAGFVSPLSGAPILVTAGLTLGHAYVITLVGTTTQAQWQALGLSPTIPAAVGVSFIATSAAAGVGTGVVEQTVAAGIDHVEVIGDANQMNNENQGSVIGSGAGMILILACYKNTVLTAPADGTVIGLGFNMNNTEVGV
jgi:hypothetical protein